MRKKNIERVLNEMYEVTAVLNEEGQSYAESRYKEIVAMTLLAILDHLRALRAILCFLLGGGIALLLEHFFVL